MYPVMTTTTKAIRKNDIVTNNTTVTSYNTVVPIGTKFRVWKAKRDGTLYTTNIDSKQCYTTLLHVNDVTKVDDIKPDVKVGDIFVCSWGYDQTNIDYYKVLAVKNKSVIIAEVSQTRNYTGNMQGECMPDVDNVVGKPMTKRIGGYGDSVSLKMTSYSWAYKWSGKTNHFTEWA